MTITKIKKIQVFTAEERKDYAKDRKAYSHPSAALCDYGKFKTLRISALKNNVRLQKI